MSKKGLSELILTVFFLMVLIFPAVSGAQDQGGEYLIFAYKTGDFFDTIQRMSAGATDTQQPLYSMPGVNLNCPRVSNDNVNMAFVDADTGTIFVSQIGVTDPVALANSIPARSLAWSSDGTLIYFWGPDFVFYSIPAQGGAATPLFGGQAYWAWFNDGGFDVMGALREDGTYQDYILAGATTAEYGKVNLIQLEVKAEAVDPVGIFAGLADNYTPSRGALDGRFVFQADHDGAGSHRVYTFNPEDGTATALTDLYSGSPVWNSGQSLFAFVHAPSSTYGSTAYQGIIYTRHQADGAIVPQFTSGIGVMPSFYGVAPSEQ